MKILLIPISKEQIKPLITLAFEGDRELLETYHINPGDLEHCVNHTYAFIEKNKDFYDKDMHCYKVVHEDETGTQTEIGFTVTIINENLPNELYSFGIAKAFRKKDILQSWLKATEEAIHVPYFSILWSVNKRAINFFEKNDFIVEERGELRKLIIKG